MGRIGMWKAFVMYEKAKERTHSELSAKFRETQANQKRMDSFSLVCGFARQCSLASMMAGFGHWKSLQIVDTYHRMRAVETAHAAQTARAERDMLMSSMKARVAELENNALNEKRMFNDERSRASSIQQELAELREAVDDIQKLETETYEMRVKLRECSMEALMS